MDTLHNKEIEMNSLGKKRKKKKKKKKKIAPIMEKMIESQLRVDLSRSQ